jgi:hypothetical protein
VIAAPDGLEELQHLAIERACERLVVTYSHFIDLGEAGRVAELFTADGVWASAEGTLRSRDEIAKAFAQRQSNTGRRSRHVCTNLRIDVAAPTEAAGLCYFTLYRADDVEGPFAVVDGPAIVGEYRDRFVLTDEGWRFAQREASAGFLFPSPS